MNKLDAGYISDYKFKFYTTGKFENYRTRDEDQCDMIGQGVLEVTGVQRHR